MTEYKEVIFETSGGNVILPKKGLESIFEVMDKLEEKNQELEEENKKLKQKVDDLMNMELEDRDIVCQAGKFRLEEWGKHRLHQFYDGDTPLEDETVVIRLMDLTTENERLKSENNMLKVTIGRNEAYIKRLTEISEWHC